MYDARLLPIELGAPSTRPAPGRTRTHHSPDGGHALSGDWRLSRGEIALHWRRANRTANGRIEGAALCAPRVASSR
jgi:hypothetical protein